MIAEIKGKISSTGSNLSDRLEDKLTGDVFGHIKYLPAQWGIIPILQACHFDNKEKQELANCLLEDDNFTYHFWPNYEDGEPDLILKSKNAIILIEVKYLSGLSSDDEVEDPEVSRNQLARESKILQKIRADKKAFLIFLAPKESAATIHRQTLEKNQIGNEVAFAYLSWSSLLEALITVFHNDYLEFPFNHILNDTIQLLKHKGFERFKSFKLYITKDVTCDAFCFNRTINKTPFTFQTTSKITTDHYEFR